MKISFFYLFFCLIFCVNSDKSDKILIVSDNTFNKTVKKFSPSLVEFTADPCEHCWDLDNIFKQIWRRNKEMNLTLSFVKINITRNLALKERFNITEYPQLKLFKEGELIENYTFSPIENEVTNWLKKRINPPVSELISLISVLQFIRKNENCLLYFGSKLDPTYKILNYTSNNIIHVNFIQSEEKEIGSHYNIKEGNMILFQKFSEKEIIIKAKIRDSEHLSYIIRTKFLDNLKRFNGEVNKLVFNLGTPGLFLYRDNKHYYTRHYDIIMEETARMIKGKNLTVVTSELNSKLEKSMSEMLGVFPDDMPCIRLFDTREGLKKYRMDDEITSENIIRFINQWENDNLTEYIKTDKLPKKMEGPITTLVSSNFNETVYNETKDVLVLFCNTVNENCTEFEPIYENFAKKAKHHSNDTLLVTYINNRLNELVNFKVNKVPTLKLFPSGNTRKVVDFTDEDYSYDNLIDFVIKNTNENNGFKKLDL